MPKGGLRTVENPSCKITYGNQRINDLQCCRDSKNRYPEESAGIENLFEIRRLKAARVRTHLK